MDILFYSNYCKHSQKLLQYLAKHGLTQQLNCISIDKRTRDPNTNQTSVITENGQTIPLPVNVHSVPTLLLVSRKYSALTGDAIYTHFETTFLAKSIETTASNQSGNEPFGFVLNPSTGGVNIQSEQYTFYNMSSNELSAKGNGGMRQMHNYFPASHKSAFTIPTPDDTYRPDKLGGDVTLDKLQQKRNSDITDFVKPPPLSEIGVMPGNLAVIPNSSI